jgi:hypothetical protein
MSIGVAKLLLVAEGLAPWKISFFLPDDLNQQTTGYQ